MNIKFYNTINRRKEDFNSIVDKEVKLYTCGPTVYDFAHIGNFRAYLFEDILRRIPSIVRLNKTLKYKPKTNLVEGLKLILKEMQKNI